MDHPNLGMKIMDSVDKNKLNKNNRNLHADLHIYKVSSELVNDKEESNEPSSSMDEEEFIANCSILAIPSTQPENLLINESNCLSSEEVVAENNNNVTSTASVSKQAINN